jgi:mono/diheme cytochrome c family protein
MIRRILAGVATLAVIAGLAALLWVASRQNLKFDAPYPSLRASTDSAVVARGRYLVRSLVGCGGCHGDPRRHQEYMEGADVPLSGGRAWEIPPGTFYARNITPDRETGIGSFPDSTIARALRYGVGHDGRALLPFMEMQGLSDEDLVAVVSYLVAQPPVRNPVPAHRFNHAAPRWRTVVTWSSRWQAASPVTPSATWRPAHSLARDSPARPASRTPTRRDGPGRLPTSPRAGGSPT